jgi:hypothetical protein
LILSALLSAGVTRVKKGTLRVAGSRFPRRLHRVEAAKIVPRRSGAQEFGATVADRLTQASKSAADR